MFCRECGKHSVDPMCADCTDELLERARPDTTVRFGPRIMLDRDLEDAIDRFEGHPIRR